MKIESLEENDFIKANYLTGGGKYWIGLSDSETEGDWKWADGTKLSEYTNWGPQQPNDNSTKANQDCVDIRLGSYRNRSYDGEWNDVHCSKTKGFICEK